MQNLRRTSLGDNVLAPQVILCACCWRKLETRPTDDPPRCIACGYPSIGAYFIVVSPTLAERFEEERRKTAI